MVKFSSTYRSTEVEIMDDLNLQGDEMKLLLTDLKNLNKWLGGNYITHNGISKLLKKGSKNRTYTIVDLGCGDGEMLRQCSYFADKHSFRFELIGIDANQFILDEAKKKSVAFENISFKKIDVFSEEFTLPPCDIVLCSLFLHHFSNDAIIELLGKLAGVAKVGIVVNDLHRSKIAFGLFRLMSFVFVKTKIARHDGLVSIARGFKKREMKALSEKMQFRSYSIQWKWAFRYQWIIKTGE